MRPDPALLSPAADGARAAATPTTWIAVDTGKSTIKMARVRVPYPGGPFELLPGRGKADLPELNTIDDAAALIRAAAGRFGVPPAETDIAMTFALPTLDGRIVGREEMMVFDGQEPEVVAKALRVSSGVRALKLAHDSTAQVRFVLARYAPAGPFAVLACGTSFGFTMAWDGKPDLFTGFPSTFSHLELAGEGPQCRRCGCRCIGAWYQHLYKAGGSTAPAVARAAAAAARLPVSAVFVTGGALADDRVREAVLGLAAPLSAARVRLVDEYEFSGAIGAALS